MRATSESIVSEQDEIFRQCMDAWAKEQQEYADQMAESLAALDAYEQQLHEWQAKLASEADHLAEEKQELEAERKQLAKKTSSDVAITAELDQARAEIEDLRHRLADMTDPVVAASAVATAEPVAAAAPARPASTDPTVSAVAKQFQRLRQQQAARRGHPRSSDS